MLINCPECAHAISNLASACPVCGYPLPGNTKPVVKNRKYHRTRAKMRLPNGFGQITELKGRNLRKPFRAMVTVGKTEHGKPICKILKPEGYFATYNEAYSALIEYNKAPYDLDPGITVEEVYEKWMASLTLSKSSIDSYKYLWKFLSSVRQMRMKDIRVRHIKYSMYEQRVIPRYGGTKDGVTASACQIPKVKLLWNMLFKYAIENEIVDRNYAKDVQIPKEVFDKSNEERSEHKIFSQNEMDLLWENITNITIRMILIQCYSGWRPGELLDLKVSDVDISNWTFKGGAKTRSGKNRIVPIHESIRDMVKDFYDDAIKYHSETLFFMTKSIKPIGYSRFRYRFDVALKAIGINQQHKPHDGRKHFITKAKEAGMDEYAIKRIVGHHIDDLTESVYTIRTIEWLTNEMKKIEPHVSK